MESQVSEKNLKIDDIVTVENGKYKTMYIKDITSEGILCARYEANLNSVYTQLFKAEFIQFKRKPNTIFGSIRKTEFGHNIHSQIFIPDTEN